MTRFDDLDDAAILALTDEEIQYYIDLACAEDGAPLLPPDPGAKPAPPTPEHDVTAYEVGGFLFASMHDAQDVANLVNDLTRVRSDYAPGGSYREHVINPEPSAVTVTSVRAFSPTAWNAQRAEVLKATAAVETWQKNRDEFDKVAKRRGEVAEWIVNRLAEVREAAYQRDRYVAELARYVTLAQGDEAIARTFLLKAHPEAAEYLPAMETAVAGG